MGALPSWAVQIDVSGRVDGHVEVMSLLLVLLGSGGVAVDDYTDELR